MYIRRFSAAAAVMVAVVASSTALAGDITVDQAWARASAGPAKAGAAFLTIHNRGADDDRVIGAKADVSRKAELHTHIMEGDLMKMREVEGGIEVPAGKTVAFQPGGLHVMFMGLNAPFKEGEHFPLTLVFERAGEVKTDVQILGPGAKSAPGAHDHGAMNMDGHGHGQGKMPQGQ